MTTWTYSEFIRDGSWKFGHARVSQSTVFTMVARMSVQGVSKENGVCIAREGIPEFFPFGRRMDWMVINRLGA